MQPRDICQDLLHQDRLVALQLQDPKGMLGHCLHTLLPTLAWPQGLHRQIRVGPGQRRSSDEPLCGHARRELQQPIGILYVLFVQLRMRHCIPEEFTHWRDDRSIEHLLELVGPVTALPVNQVVDMILDREVRTHSRVVRPRQSGRGQPICVHRPRVVHTEIGKRVGQAPP